MHIQNSVKHLALRKIPLFQLISWCGNFVEKQRFCIVSHEPPKKYRRIGKYWIEHRSIWFENCFQPLQFIKQGYKHVIKLFSQEFFKNFAKISSLTVLLQYRNSYFQDHLSVAVSKLEWIQSFFKIICFIKGVLMISMHICTCSASVSNQFLWTLPVVCISKSCIKIKITHIFIFTLLCGA